MQALAYSESTSSTVIPRLVAAQLVAALGSSSAMCVVDPVPTICDVPVHVFESSCSTDVALPLSAVNQRPKSDSELVISLHDRSGLTWEQLAKTIGVSRRSLHMWAAGSTVTRAHRVAMERLDRLIARINMAPNETRAKLLEQRLEGGSLLDQFRRERDAGRREINGPVFNAYEMLER